MPDRRREIATQLDRLVRDGGLIRMSEVIRTRPEEQRNDLVKKIKAGAKSAKKVDKARGAEGTASTHGFNRQLLELIEGDDFGRPYQRWYSEALGVVQQLLPDRYVEFRELYRLDKQPKELDVTTYTVSNYVHGTIVSQGGVPVFDSGSVALGRVKDQVDILASAGARLDSLLTDIEGTLEATLLDDELGTAGELLRAKHLRSAGVVAGVVLERHLKTVASNHGVKLGRKKPQIGSLNDALKDSKVFDNPLWREVQRLGDIRNICAHDDEREPKAQEVQELIESTEKIVKTVF
jgi:hypothetical protein